MRKLLFSSVRYNINQQVKDMKEDFKTLKVGHESEDSPLKNGKWSRRNPKKKPLRPPGKNETTRRKRKRKAKAVVTVER